ncbi:MAG: CBS domain-containing protein [Bacteriovoracaceae bacterium]
MKDKVDKIMSEKIYSLSPDESMLDAYKLMFSKGIRHLVILSDNKLEGILSDRDILKAIRADRIDNSRMDLSLNTDLKIKDFMSWPVYTVSESTSIERVTEEVIKQKVSAFVVENNQGEVTGIVTTEDLLKHFLYSLKNNEQKSNYTIGFATLLR